MFHIYLYIYTGYVFCETFFTFFFKSQTIFRKVVAFAPVRVFHGQFLIGYIFPISLEFGACFTSRVSGGELGVKYATLFFHIVFFHNRICVFIISISFFDEVLNFHKRILTNMKQELVIGNCQ